MQSLIKLPPKCQEYIAQLMQKFPNYAVIDEH